MDRPGAGVLVSPWAFPRLIKQHFCIESDSRSKIKVAVATNLRISLRWRRIISCFRNPLKRSALVISFFSVISLSHLGLGWLDVFSLFPLPLPKWLLPLTSKPFALNFRYLGWKNTGPGKCTGWPFHDLNLRSWLWHWLTNICLSARWSENHSPRNYSIPNIFWWFFFLQIPDVVWANDLLWGPLSLTYLKPVTILYLGRAHGSQIFPMANRNIECVTSKIGDWPKFLMWRSHWGESIASLAALDRLLHKPVLWAVWLLTHWPLGNFNKILDM